MPRNLKLTIAYDGADFHGWQMQPDRQTVQGSLADVLLRLTGERLAVHGAGRTDAGVHACGQVAHFQTDAELSPAELVRAMNALLPSSIRICDAKEVALAFHARWLATAKTYRYRIYRGDVVPPFIWKYVLHDRQPLDFDAMSAAARCFEGDHDFTSFAASTGSDDEDQDRTMVRTIDRSELLRVPASVDGMPDGEEWIYVVRGRSFLRNMVRKIVGTLLEVGRGRFAATDIPNLLEFRDRTRSGPTAPPHGLCLISVEYPTAEQAARRNI